MKVIQSVSGDNSFVDFAITRDEKLADVYSVSIDVLNRINFKEKLDKFVILTESGIDWTKIKIEKGKHKIDTEMFQIISAFLTGSTRGRTDSTFECAGAGESVEPESKRPRMDIVLSIDTRLTNEEVEEYKNIQELMKQIKENEQLRRDQLDEWAKGWEEMTPEEIDELNRKYDQEMEQECEQKLVDDPDYEPDSSDSDSDSDSDSTLDSTTDCEDKSIDTTEKDSNIE